MRKFINIFAGIIYGLAPFVGVIIIGLVIYDSLPNLVGIVIIIVLVTLSIWLGIQIFKRIQIVGPLEFMSTVHASPDLDNLEPGPDSETKRRQPDEFVGLMKKKENLFKGGTFRIYGDWFGEPYKNYHEIEEAQFDSQTNILTLQFNRGERLEIHGPKHIFEASTFLKVLAADRIKLTWDYKTKLKKKVAQYYLDYQKVSKEIKTETNVDWYKPIFDVSLGAPALMIYG